MIFNFLIELLEVILNSEFLFQFDRLLHGLDSLFLFCLKEFFHFGYNRWVQVKTF